MSRALRLIMLVSTVLMGALSASLFIALRTRPHPTLRQLRAVLFDNWGLHGVFQLNAGLLLAAIWILCVQRNKWVGLLWVAAMVLVGHIATLGYIIYRAAQARTVAEIFMPQARLANDVPQPPAIQRCDATFNVDLPEPTAMDSAAPSSTPVSDSARMEA